MKRSFWATMDNNEQRMRRLQFKRRKSQLVDDADEGWNKIKQKVEYALASC